MDATISAIETSKNIFLFEELGESDNLLCAMCHEVLSTDEQDCVVIIFAIEIVSLSCF